MRFPNPISFASEKGLRASVSLRSTGSWLCRLACVLLPAGFLAAVLSPLDGFAQVDRADSSLHVYAFERGGAVGLMDQHGSVLSDPVFDEAGRASGEFIPLRSGVRWGLWAAGDSSWAVDPAYDALLIASDSIVSVKDSDGWSLLSVTGRALGPGVFHELRFPSDGVFSAAVAVDHGPVDERVRWGVFSVTGDTLLVPAFDNLLAFSEGMAPARTSRRLLRFIKRSPRWGFISPGGEWLISPEYDSARSFSNGLALVSEGGELFFIDRAGRRRIDVSHDFAYGFSEGRARIVDQGLWGWMDTEGSTVIAPEWEGALDFSEGLAAVRRAGRWGYVDTHGRTAIPVRFDAAAPFRGPLAEVSLDGRRFRIDRTGQEVEPRMAGDRR